MSLASPVAIPGLKSLGNWIFHYITSSLLNVPSTRYSVRNLPRLRHQDLKAW